MMDTYQYWIDTDSNDFTTGLHTLVAMDVNGSLVLISVDSSTIIPWIAVVKLA